MKQSELLEQLEDAQEQLAELREEVAGLARPRITYWRTPDGAAHPPGIYLNAYQLWFDLQAEGFPEAAERVRRVTMICSRSPDGFVHAPPQAPPA